MSSAHGKVALVSSDTELTCAGDCAGTSAVVDFVGYGDADDFEGSGPAPGLSNTTSDSRDPDGTDTDDNAADFTDGSPIPQNSGGDTGGGGTGGTCSGMLTIAEIQGTDTDTSPCVGDLVTTKGVITAAYPTGGFNGFYLQTGGSGGAPADDETPAASDAVFV